MCHQKLWHTFFLKYSSDDGQRKYTVFYKCFIYFLFEHFSFGSKAVLNLSEYFYLQEVKVDFCP